MLTFEHPSFFLPPSGSPVQLTSVQLPSYHPLHEQLLVQTPVPGTSLENPSPLDFNLDTLWKKTICLDSTL